MPLSQAKVTTIFLWLWTWTGKAETKAPLFCPQRNWKGLSAYPYLWVGRYTLGPSNSTAISPEFCEHYYSKARIGEVQTIPAIAARSHARLVCRTFFEIFARLVYPQLGGSAPDQGTQSFSAATGRILPHPTADARLSSSGALATL